MTRRRWIICLGILLLGAAGRGLHLARQSFWVDEGYAWVHAHQPDLVESLARDTHPPLYFAALRLWSEAAGESELALRWFSLLPSMLSLALIFQLAREFVGLRSPNAPILGETLPPLAMLMLALADAENFLAQEARHYTWLVMLVIAAMLFMLRWLRASRRGDYGAWIVCVVLMLHTHYISAFVAVAQALAILLVTRGKARWRGLAALCVSALAALPWLALVGARQLGNRGANWSTDLNAEVLSDIVIKYFTGQWALVIALMLLGCFALEYGRGDRFRLRFSRLSWLPILWLIAPVLLTLIVNEFLPFLQPRRLTSWTPAIALLTALGLANIRAPIRGLLVGALVVYGLTQVDFYRYKPDWRSVAAMTARYAMPGDLALSDVAGGDYALGYYLRREMPEGTLLDADIRYESLKIQRDFFPATYESWLPGLLDAHDTIWLMRWSGDRGALAWLDKLGFQQSAHFVHQHDGGADGWIDLPVYRYDRLAESESVAQFENGMRLRAWRFDGDDLRADLIWSATAAVARDYTISVKLLDAAGQVAAQHDQAPWHPVSRWTRDDLVFTPRELAWKGRLPAGEYQLVAQVYAMADGLPRNVATDAGAEMALLGEIRLNEPRDRQ